MNDAPVDRMYWRVGYHGDPLGFVPSEICEWSHRFDDLRHRFRSVYVAELAETCLREVLADFRPKLSAIRHFQREMGAEAAQELAAQPIMAAWRRENVLAPVRLQLDGPICDLTDVPQRQKIEERHIDLLFDYPSTIAECIAPSAARYEFRRGDGVALLDHLLALANYSDRLEMVALARDDGR